MHGEDEMEGRMRGSRETHLCVASRRVTYSVYLSPSSLSAVPNFTYQLWSLKRTGYSDLEDDSEGSGKTDIVLRLIIRLLFSCIIPCRRSSGRPMHRNARSGSRLILADSCYQRHSEDHHLSQVMISTQHIHQPIHLLDLDLVFVVES